MQATGGGAGDVEKGAWGEIFRGGLGLYSALIIGGIAMQATQMLVIAIIMPTVVADIGGADYYTWAAMLYTIGSIVGGASTGTIWARVGPKRRPRPRSICSCRCCCKSFTACRRFLSIS
jgi:MFS family permease